MNGDYTIDLSGIKPKVLIDGQELPCAEVYVQQRHGEYPSVTVILDASTSRVSGKGGIDIRASVEASLVPFLKKIDVGKLEAEVMARTPFSANVFENVKTVLLEWANGS